MRYPGPLAPTFALILLGAAGADPATADPVRLKEPAFRDLMAMVERGWTAQDTDLALSAFAADAVYMEPPNFQLFRGHAELQALFRRSHLRLLHAVPAPLVRRGKPDRGR